ncbi:putative bifunctional diguanylate cyclase/phosphodiesterase [Pseudaestuariivita rosea]|uniref:putative bifunctional diguanylate cyclase/phosphodiesterase n=1 Tax=Pseudaestuariivita rosea TaxID=2763263 RepID=UPI001ABB68DC|nr:bifunctional diguanylate cyclase/phosphodiesterase [Pseudaestuariivita rosea]
MSKRQANNANSVFEMALSFGFLSACTAASYAFAGEKALLIAGFALPIVFFAFYAFRLVWQRAGKPKVMPGDPRDNLISMLDSALETGHGVDQKTFCMVVELDDADVVVRRYGKAILHKCLITMADRIKDAMRDEDLVVKLDGNCFAIGLGPMRHLDIEMALQIAKRVQKSVEEPMVIDTHTLHLSVSIGVALPGRIESPNGERLLDAAECALLDAMQNQPSGIRCYVPEMRNRIENRNALIDEISVALENGEIVPWFQPQVSAKTGKLAGFEALARWMHPKRGLLQPADFLIELEQAGLMERLGEVVMYHAFAALRAWDRAGFEVPTIGINFSGMELQNPKLVDKLKWQLDRFELTPDRLSVEVLETVMARGEDDIITRNVRALSDLGCNIDLDDFGTGNASISNVRRFAVQRIKIDRSFVTKLDEDQDQQRLVSAIITMAQRLGLDTVAEGVETVSEHAVLSELGCTYVQGFGISRAMPVEETVMWMRDYIRRTDPAAERKLRSVI